MNRVAAYVNPVTVVGTALSVIVSMALDLTNAASGPESFLAALMGIAITLILDATYRAERRFTVRSMVSAAPWLGRALERIAHSVTEIERRYPGSAFADEARARVDRLYEELDRLRQGRIDRPRGDYGYLVAFTESRRTCRRTLHAVTNVVPTTAGPLGWWARDGQRYWEANLDALRRGVRITRVFVYTGLTAELRALVARQRAAGVRVGLVDGASIDPELRLNLAIWDGVRGWESGLNAGGEIVTNLVTVNRQDLVRLDTAFRRCAEAADFGEPEAVASGPERAADASPTTDATPTTGARAPAARDPAPDERAG